MNHRITHRGIQSFLIMAIAVSLLLLASGSGSTAVLQASGRASSSVINTPPERTENPGAFLSWPLPASIGLTNITRLPDTKWTHNFLGITDCPPYPALLDAGHWPHSFTNTYEGNRHMILPDSNDDRVRWQNRNDSVPGFGNAFSCYGETRSLGLPSHHGTDISAANNTVILAAAPADQVVVMIDGDNDPRVALRHSNINGTDQTLWTLYLHLTSSVYPPGTHNVNVPVGAEIGTVGNGHLHFELATNWVHDEPYKRNPWGIDIAPWKGCLWLDADICPQVPGQPDDEEQISTGHFSDVSIEHPFFPYIEALYAIGALSPNANFNPDDDAHRDAAAKYIIVGLDEYREYNDGVCAFSDVCPGHTFYHYIRRMKELGITQGFSDGTYKPGEDMTRGGLAAFIVRARGETPNYTDGRQHFSDVPPSHSQYHFIERLYEIGAVNGFSDGTFRPEEAITRAALTKVVVLGLPGLRDHIPTFYDVLYDNQFYRYVKAIAARGITRGCRSGTPPIFCPDNNLTRAEAAAFIIRGLGEEPDYTDGRQSFSDVQSSHPFYDYIERLRELEIASGFSDGTYRPDEPITRGAIAKLIILALGEEPHYTDGLQVFPDVPTTHTFYHYIRRLYELGITSGFSDGTYRPDEPNYITRAAAAKFMALALVYRTPAAPQEASDQSNDNSPTAPTYETRSRYIVPAEDTDYIKLVVPAVRAASGGAVTYQLVTDYMGLSADLQIDLFAADGNTLLATKQRDGNEEETILSWSPPAAGTYYVRLTNTNPFATEGVYTDFSVETAASTSPTVTPTSTTTPAVTPSTPTVTPIVSLTPTGIPTEDPLLPFDLYLPIIYGTE